MVHQTVAIFCDLDDDNDGIVDTEDDCPQDSIGCSKLRPADDSLDFDHDGHT